MCLRSLVFSFVNGFVCGVNVLPWRRISTQKRFLGNFPSSKILDSCWAIHLVGKKKKSPKKNGRIVVTASKGAAREGGVEEGDFLVQIGDAQLDDRLKDVDDAAKCKKVKEIVVSFPRPLRMVFAKPDAAILRSGGGDDDDDDASVASSVATASSGKSKKRWSLFGKKGGSTSSFRARACGLGRGSCAEFPS